VEFLWIEQRANVQTATMALAQKLAQFTKQQEKLQASLATLPARPPKATPSSAASRKAPAPPPRSQPLVPLAQRFSFTNDTEKLQQIATIQKSPVGAQIKRVLDLLLEVPPELPLGFGYVGFLGNRICFQS